MNGFVFTRTISFNKFMLKILFYCL